jgi:hypothetical protein
MGMIWAIAATGAAVVGAAVSRLIADDTKEWTPRITERLIDCAVTRLPSAQRGRFAEEWRSHVSDTPGCIGKLWVAAGCICAARQIDQAVMLQRQVEHWGTFRRWIQQDSGDAFRRIGAQLIIADGMSASDREAGERLRVALARLTLLDFILTFP